MTNNYAIRFVSLEGGVSLFVNGFLVFAKEDEGRSVTQASLFVRPGKNLFELVPSEPGKSASLSFVDMSEGDPEKAPVLLSVSTDGKLPTPVFGELEITSDIPNFEWHNANEIGDLDTFTDEIYRKVQALGKALQNGPDNELVRILSLKHKEIAQAVGLSKSEMDEGLLGGLSNVRDMPEFAVDIVERDDFLALVSTNGRIVNARRKSGGHALKMMDDFENPGFSIALAQFDKRWVIVR